MLRKKIILILALGGTLADDFSEIGIMMRIETT